MGKGSFDAAPKRTVPTRAEADVATASHRAEDMDAESELAAFLDARLYAGLLGEGNFTAIERVTDKQQQLCGIDVILRTSTSVAYVDEKAQLYYINKDIPTFAFELQFLRRGEAKEGWLLNDDLKTDHYLLIWPFASVTDVKALRREDFTRLDVLVIAKSRLCAELASLGLTKQALAQRADELRRTHTYGKIPTGLAGIYYYASEPSRYAEAPINLVITKTRLAALADAHYEVTRDGFRRV